MRQQQHYTHDYKQFRQKFLVIQKYQTVHKELIKLIEKYSQWTQYLSSLYKLNHSRKSLFQIITHRSKHICSTDIEVDEEQSNYLETNECNSVKFMKCFAQQQFTINQNHRKQIKKSDNKAQSNFLKKLGECLHQLEKQINNYNQSIGKCQKINQKYQSKKQKLQNQFHSPEFIISQPFYEEQNWKKRLKDTEKALEEIKHIQLEEHQKKHPKTLEILEKISETILNFRKIIIKFKNHLGKTFVDFNQNLLSNLYELINVGANKLVQISSRLNDESSNQQELSNQKYCKIFQFLKKIYLSQHQNFQFQLGNIKIKNQFSKQTMITVEELMIEFANFKKQLVYQIINTISFINQLNNPDSHSYRSAKQITKSFIEFIKKSYQQFQMKISKKIKLLESQKNSFLNSKKLQIHAHWPNQDHLWLWDEFDYKYYFKKVISQVCQDKNYIKTQQRLEKYITYCNKMLQFQQSRCMFQGQGTLYHPFESTVNFCIFSSKIVLKTNKKNQNLIIPKKYIKNTTNNGDHLDFQIKGKVALSIGQFKQTNWMNKITELLEDNNEKNNTTKRSHSETSEQTSEKQIELFEITKQEKQYIFQRKQQIEGNIKLKQYKKYKQTELGDCDIRDVYQAIFSDKQPYFNNKSFQNFFAYMADLSGDKNYKTSKYDKSGPRYYTGNKDVKFTNCPEFSTRKTFMVHKLPNIPFVPSQCECHQNGRIYWVDDQQFIYIAKVNLTGASMLEGVVTKILYRVTSYDSVKLQVFGKVEVQGKKFKSVLQKGAYNDMKQITTKVSYQIQEAMQKYLLNHKKVPAKSKGITQ